MRHDAIPGYLIEELIGTGGMASVYLATQESLGRRVAVKVLNDPDSPEFSWRFINEGRIIARLTHTNIITVHDIGIVDGLHYILMEYVQGGDLTRKIAEGIIADEALGLIDTLASCLHFAHQKGIIHRDIKPANILFRSDGTPLLSDFGIAKELNSDSSVTNTRILLGSPHYISPEQALGTQADARVDIYSLGIMLYEMLTGEKPHQGTSDIATIIKHIQDPIPKLPAPHRRYQELLDRMTARELEQRFASAGELIDFIKNLRDSNIQPVDRITVQQPEQRFADISKGLPDLTLRALGKEVARLKAALIPYRRSLVLALQRSGLSDVPWSNKWGLLLSGLLFLLTVSGVFVAWPTDQPLEKIEPAPTAKPSGNDTSSSVAALDQNRAAVGSWTTPKEQEIEKLLGLGNTALIAYRLTTPADENALHYYERVLDLDPENGDAKRGFTKIADRYSHLAASQIDRGHYKKAREYITRGLKIDPENKTLNTLKRQAYRKRTRSKPNKRTNRRWKNFTDQMDQIGGEVKDFLFR